MMLIVICINFEMNVFNKVW